jgi:hypothetical protein
MKNKIISVRFKMTDIERLKTLAEKLRINLSALIRISVSKVLEKGGINQD